MNIKELVETAHATAREKGFYDPPATFVEQLALVHSEVSEALEAYREHGFLAWARDDGKPEGVASELADVVVRIADMCGAHGIDLEAALAQKMAFNATRSFRHGGKRV